MPKQGALDRCGGRHNKSLELSPKVVSWFELMSLPGFASRW